MHIGIPDNFQGIPGLTIGAGAGIAGSVNTVPNNQDLYKGKFFQWMNGKKVGLVEQVQRTIIIGNKQTVVLESGVQIPVDEFITTFKPVDSAAAKSSIQIDNAGPPLTPESQNFINSLKTFDNMPVKEVKNNDQSGSNEQKTDQQYKTSTNNSDPVISILSKKKENICIVKCELQLDLPKLALFEMLIDDFDKSPEEILQLIINDKNIEKIKEQLINILLNYYGFPDVKKETEEIILQTGVSQYELDVLNTLNEIVPLKTKGEDNENANPL